MKNLYLSVLILASANLLCAQAPFFTEAFDGGLPATWTAAEVQGDGTPSANWTYTTEGPQGAFSAGVLMSTTAENGWMIYDSDLNCTQAEQEALLISPMIDASAQANVFVEFETRYRSFDDNATLLVSVDSINWTEVQLFDIGANDYGDGIATPEDAANPQKVITDITSIAANAPTLWIAFRFLSDATTGNGGAGFGCGYAWQIDDVALVGGDPRPANNLVIPEGSIAIAPNAIMPLSQVTPFPFASDVANIGNTAQDAALIDVSMLYGENQDVVFTTAIEYPALASDSLSENVASEDLFVPTETGDYIGVYTASIPGVEDADTSDNTRSFDLTVSDTLYSKSTDLAIAISPASDNDFSYGNCYYVANGDGMYARYVTFAVSNTEPLAGLSANIFLYKWDGDTNGDLAATPDEYGGAPIAFNTYTFDGTESVTLLNVPVSDENEGVALENDSYYFVVVQFESGGNDDLRMPLIGSQERNYTNMYLTSVANGAPRYAAMLDVGNTGDYGIVGFGLNTMPFVAMSVSSEQNLGGMVDAVEEFLSEDNKIALSPNPAQDFATLDIDLVNTQQVSVQMYDVTGKLVLLQSYQQLQNANLTLDVSELAAGTYFVKVNTEAGVRTTKLIVK